ncbi:Uncharacterised protein [Salmonella enterica subsp. enterica serovar Bovismorbificans]|uniref:Uncharacterized protein n=1 Tax=Salmonella enterica subsp. enterica serovar Bovismorbificans TaxID=58097 RepID=A0A655ECW0_SALET|nr:Uncharacterised protein [Salmonella enterica subsp. enterica serovar Bovismorbificans]
MTPYQARTAGNQNLHMTSRVGRISSSLMSGF